MFSTKYLIYKLNKLLYSRLLKDIITNFVNKKAAELIIFSSAAYQFTENLVYIIKVFSGCPSCNAVVLDFIKVSV